MRDVLSSPSPAETADALTELILDVFRLNGSLLASGDALVGDLGLTSARWQVLGAIALAPHPLPVASLARTMGLSRQSVQRLVDEMKADAWVRLMPNPHHRLSNCSSAGLPNPVHSVKFFTNLKAARRKKSPSSGCTTEESFNALTARAQ